MKKNRPSAAEAALMTRYLMDGLKAVPFNSPSFSASG
jgi:hypothetical protein